MFQKHIENNPLYKDVTIDTCRLNLLPENGRIDYSVPTVNFEYAENNHIEHEQEIDRGPIDLDSEDDTVYNEDTEMTSFLPMNVNSEKQISLVEEEISKAHSHKYPWITEETPLNEYRTEYLKFSFSRIVS